MRSVASASISGNAVSWTHFSGRSGSPPAQISLLAPQGSHLPKKVGGVACQRYPCGELVPASSLRRSRWKNTARQRCVPHACPNYNRCSDPRSQATRDNNEASCDASRDVRFDHKMRDEVGARNILTCHLAERRGEPRPGFLRRGMDEGWQSTLRHAIIFVPLGELGHINADFQQKSPGETCLR